MVYIVSDERIAVENFEQGKIYKVDFVDESVLYGVCVGIGSDFVMLSGDISGYIFPLTMQTASQVTSIDLYDPTPPEPPVPWSNLLQYQTGVPPFEFPTTDSSLFSWYIVGEGVGDKTANLFDVNTVVKGRIDSGNVGYASNTTSLTISANDISCTINYAYRGFSSDFIPISTANLYINYESSSATYIVAVYYDSSKTWINSDVSIPSQNKYASLTVPTGAAYIRFSFTFSTAGTYTVSNFMLNTGSTALPYEPYGYKIPILCNEHLTNIYLDAPLSEGEILHSTDIDTAIVTDIGDNELSVETTQQPTAMQIVYKIADR